MSEAPAPISTVPCPVTLRLADGTSLVGNVWLLPDPSGPGGVTTVQALFDGPRHFLAVGLPNGERQFVSRSAVVSIELASSGPGVAEETDPGALFDVVTLHLEKGEELSGVLRATGAEGYNRMSDILNLPGRFVALGAGDKVILAAKARIVRVSF